MNNTSSNDQRESETKTVLAILGTIMGIVIGVFAGLGIIQLITN